MTSRNYLFNSIKENIRRNFYLFILITLGFLAIFPLKTIMALDRAKAIIPMENEMNPVKMEFLNCIGMENNMATIFIGVIAVLLGVIGFCYLYSGEKTDFYHSLPLKREELFVIPFFQRLFHVFCTVFIECRHHLLNWHRLSWSQRSKWSSDDWCNWNEYFVFP